MAVEAGDHGRFDPGDFMNDQPSILYEEPMEPSATERREIEAMIAKFARSVAPAATVCVMWPSSAIKLAPAAKG